MPVSPAELRRRARKIKLLLMDVDGVLTDGRIYYLPRPGGEMFETKTFHSRDGFGLRLAREAGLKTDRKSTRLNSSHGYISYAVFCLKKKKKKQSTLTTMTT